MRVCETVMTSTMAGLRAGRDAAAAPSRAGKIALVELRLDGLAPGELNVAAALADRALPVVVTCRPVWEGGQFAGTEEERLAILVTAARLGAEFIDIEMDADRHQPGAIATLRSTLKDSSRLVISHHNFTPGIPADLADRLAILRHQAHVIGAGTVSKMAIMAERTGDCAVLRRHLCVEGALAPHSIAIAMGSAGVLSRVLPAKFCTAWTYAGAAAPGQIGVDLLITRYRLDAHSERTRAFGIAGAPLSHSASPAMHNAAFAEIGVDAVFVPVETADADELFTVADALAIEGLSVTAPLKTSVLATNRSVTLDANAFRIGAVNTLKRETDGEWHGRNFDAAAFRAPLEAHAASLSGRRAIVLGAGGAARAAAHELRALGATVEIAARDRAKAATLASSVGAGVADWPPVGDAAVLVNATPVGTVPHIDRSPIAAGTVAAKIAYDLVYNPEETQFLNEARTAGAHTIGGLAMLVAQAGRQFEWWTGARVSSAVLTRAAQEFIR